MKYFLKVPIVEIERLTVDLFRFELESREIAANCKPGQFVNVKVADEDYPLLRRPLSIHSTDGTSRFELVFRVVGMGTKLLAARVTGEHLDLIGPLGIPFDIDPERHALLVGGGVGIPPIHALLQEILKRRIPHTAIVGLRNADEIGLAGMIPEQAAECMIATDDGTLGHHGFVTELLEDRLSKDAAVYACGPHPMLMKIVNLTKKASVPTQISFEQQMACALGACIGCSIETNSGYQRVCTEGPVFNARLFDQ